MNKKHLKYYQLFLICIFFNFLFSPNTFAKNNNQSDKQIIDDRYHFETIIPGDWVVKQFNTDESLLRFSIYPQNKKILIKIFAFDRPGVIRLEKLAALDRKIFDDLGKLVDKKTIKKYFFIKTATEKIYYNDKNKIYSLLYSLPSGTYAYIIRIYSRNNDFSTSKNVIKSFKIKSHYFSNLKNTTKGILSLNWLLKILALFVGIIILYFLSWTGFSVRKGIELNKHLDSVAQEIVAKGNKLSQKWYFYRKKARMHIFFPIFGWVVFYGILATIFPLKSFLFSLFLIVCPVLGYFGLRLTFGDEAYEPEGL